MKKVKEKLLKLKNGRYTEFFIRRVRMKNEDPLVKVMKDGGMKYEECVDKTTIIFPIPMRTPKDKAIRKSGESYKCPFEEVTESEFNKLLRSMPKELNWKG